jgi:Kef-type K+ transport system membrane component KefB
LFQDLAVIPILAILPLLAMTGAVTSQTAAHGGDLAPWQRALLVVSVAAAIVAVSLVFGLLAVKFIVLLGIGKITNLEKSQNFTFAFALAQGGEFAFVLTSFAVQNQVLDQRIGNLLFATLALSMVVSPFLFVINERFVQPLFSSRSPGVRSSKGGQSIPRLR